MKILSLFDGMSCGQLALDRAGISYDNYYASEIDKYAIKVAMANYPNTIQLGSVTEWRNWDLPSIDLLIGGSPCQGFSLAGKQLNFEDPRSKLFFEFVDILNQYKPKYFLLENVRMKKEYQDIISEYLGVEPIQINSSLVSAQNRVRLYWTNIPNVTQPQDKGIILNDIIECGITDRDKSFCIDANYANGGSLEQYFNRHRRQLIFMGMADDIRGIDSVRRIYDLHGKSPTLTSCQGGHRQPKIGIIQLPHGYNKGGLYAVDGKSPSMTASSWQQNNFLFDAKDKEVGYYRKLTPTECERLQTVPSGYTNHVSNSQRYKMLGNGWTIDVIAHILKGII
jgi:DNA-cytosine methyltransferase